MAGEQDQLYNRPTKCCTIDIPNKGAWAGAGGCQQSARTVREGDGRAVEIGGAGLQVGQVDTVLVEGQVTKLKT